MKVTEINPFVRYVNYYCPEYAFEGAKRIIYDYELMYVLSGYAHMYYEGKKYLLQKGDLFYLKPNVENYLVVFEDSHFKTHCIHFDWFRMDETYSFLAEEFYTYSILSENHQEKKKLLLTRPNREPEDFRLPKHCKGLSYDKFSILFQQCYGDFLIDTSWGRLKTVADFMELIAALAQHLSGDTQSGHSHPKIVKTAEYIRNHYGEKITVARMAAMASLSPKYYGKLFTRYIGKNFNDFLQEQRLFAAKEMLIGTDRTMEEIAEEIGFGDGFYFSKCFKQSEGVSPGNYRKQMKHR